MNMRMDNQGITMIELLIVIVVIGIVSGIAIPGISGIMENTRRESVFSDALAIRYASRQTCLGRADLDVCDSQLSEETLLYSDDEDTFGRSEGSDFDYIAYGDVDQDGNIISISKELSYFHSDEEAQTENLEPLTLEAYEYEYYAINIHGNWQVAFMTEEYIYMGNPVLDDISVGHENVEPVSDEYDDLLDAFIQYLGNTSYWGSEYLGDYPHYNEVQYSYEELENGSRFIYDHPEHGQTLFEVSNKDELNTGSSDGSFKTPSDVFYSHGPYQMIIDEWHENNTYEVGDTVEHNGEEYVVHNAGEANNNEPTGFDSSRTSHRTGWNVVSDRWHPHNIYKNGDILKYGGSEYEVVNSGWANDYNPNSGNGWEEIIDDSNGSGDFDYPQWQQNTVYYGGDVVEYNGHLYYANWWTENDSPNQNYGPKGSGEPWTRIYDWNEDVDYDIGDLVIHNEIVYEAAHNNPSNREPGNENNNPRWESIE